VIPRIHSSDTQISINGIRLTGASQFDFSKDPQADDIIRLGTLYVNDRITKDAPKIEATINWTMGIGTTDPFFDIKTGSVVSIEKFNIEAKDLLGTETISGAYLTSYEISAGVGELVNGSVSYEANSQRWSSTGALTYSSQTSDSVAPFIPSKIQIANYGEGITNQTDFSIQSFTLTLPISRKSTAVLGKKIPKFRYPEFPIVGDLNFSVLKTVLTGMSEVPVLSKGITEIFLSNCDSSDAKIFSVENSSLVGISESLDLEGNAKVDFSYKFSIFDRL